MRPAIYLVLGVGCLAGCAGGNSQLATCQAEKEQLLATIRTQRDSNRALTDQVASLESRLDQAEKALAQGPGATRLSKTPEPARSARPAAVLPWRNPDETPATAISATRQGANTASARLAELARADRRLQYDARSGKARLELPLVFHEQSATLTAEDKRHLDEVAQLLKSKEARELRLVVSDLGGKTSGPQRAKAVVDYLDRHGIARERLEVGSGQGRGGAGGGGLVQLDVVGPGAPVAGVQAADQAQRR